MKLPYTIICISLLFLSASQKVFSQIEKAGNLQFNPLYNHYNSLAYSDIRPKPTKTFTQLVEAAEGSPYYDETFRQATISETKNIFKVRYNAFLDEMEIMNGDDILFIAKQQQKQLISFVETNTNYRVLWEKDADNQMSLHYFVVLEDHPYMSLYRKDSKKYVPPRNIRKGHTAKFQNVRRRFYIEINNSGNAIPVPRNNRAFAALFSSKRATIENYMNQEALKVRKEQDLQKLIKYINSI